MLVEHRVLVITIHSSNMINNWCRWETYRTPSGLEDVSQYPELFAELLRDPSWSLQDLKKLAGLNLLRVFARVEQVRRLYITWPRTWFSIARYFTKCSSLQHVVVSDCNGKLLFNLQIVFTYIIMFCQNSVYLNFVLSLLASENKLVTTKCRIIVLFLTNSHFRI